MDRAIRSVIVLCLTGVTLLFFSGTAFAQGIEGGCTAEVNGRAPSSMTEDDPLELKKNEKINVTGQAPGGQSGQTETKTYVIVLGLRVPIETTEGEGGEWGGRVELPSFLKTLTAGIYRAEADGSGEGWECSASGYIELDGGPLTVALGLGAVLAGVGAAMALGARGSSANAPDKGTIARKTGIDDHRAGVSPNRGTTLLADLLYLAALVGLYFLAMEGIPDVGESIGAALPAAAAAGGSRTVWVHGRVVRGFFGGLLLGLGVALILHQLSMWPLDLSQGLVFPLSVAVVSAIRAWIGSSFTVTPPPADAVEPVPEPVGAPPAGETVVQEAPAATGEDEQRAT